ncbi:MAG: hypothetical protein NWF12_04135 [Candidatus Bathyarchaeota archaeon]|nr:hypothetical protein [Candidatus Bathyarchaeota archaeon]
MKKPNRIKAITSGMLIDGADVGPVEGVTVLVEGYTITAGAAS